MEEQKVALSGQGGAYARDRYVGFVSTSKIFNQYRTMLRRRARETSAIID